MYHQVHIICCTFAALFSPLCSNCPCIEQERVCAVKGCQTTFHSKSNYHVVRLIPSVSSKTTPLYRGRPVRVLLLSSSPVSCLSGIPTVFCFRKGGETGYHQCVWAHSLRRKDHASVSFDYSSVSRVSMAVKRTIF